MRLTRTAIGLLTRQYRSVLRKCWMINVGLWQAMGDAVSKAVSVPARLVVSLLSGGTMNGEAFNALDEILLSRLFERKLASLTAIGLGIAAATMPTEAEALKWCISSVESTAPLRLVADSTNCADLGNYYEWGNQSGSNATALGIGAIASAKQSTALGFNANASGQNATAIGQGTAAGKNSTAIGSGSQAIYDSSVAIGRAYAQAAHSFALGDMTYALSSYSTALGDTATADGSYSTALGSFAKAYGDYSMAQGYGAEASGISSVALGSYSQATENGVVSVGRNQAVPDSVIEQLWSATSSSQVRTLLSPYGYSIVDTNKIYTDKSTLTHDEIITRYKLDGYSRIVNVADAVNAHDAVTYGQVKPVLDYVKFGADYFDQTGLNKAAMAAADAAAYAGQFEPYSTEYYQYIADYKANPDHIAEWTYNQPASADGDGATAVGKNAVANGLLSTALGTNAQAGKRAVAVGFESLASGTLSTALGTQAQATGQKSTAVGNDAQAIGMYSTAVGFEAQASSKSSAALGYNAQATGDSSMALGNHAQATGANSSALGVNALASGLSSLVIGENAQATGNFSQALGANTSASGISSVALGSYSQATENGVVSVGRNQAVPDSVIEQLWSATSALQIKTLLTSYGYSSTLDATNIYNDIQAGVLTHDEIITKYKFDGYSRITNVADAEKAHDAVTLGQLQNNYYRKLRKKDEKFDTNEGIMDVKSLKNGTNLSQERIIKGVSAFPSIICAYPFDTPHTANDNNKNVIVRSAFKPSSYGKRSATIGSRPNQFAEILVSSTRMTGKESIKMTGNATTTKQAA